MSFTDTHTHLYLEQFNDDIDSVIENSISSNVNRLFLPAINSLYTESMFLLKERYPENIFLMSGLHPCYVETNFLDEIKHVEMIINEKRHTSATIISLVNHQRIKAAVTKIPISNNLS